MSHDQVHDRHRRLRSLKETPRGNVWMALCKCGHLAPLPVASLIKRFGELLPIETALSCLTCSACGKLGTVEAKLLRLCEPGCGRHRG